MDWAEYQASVARIDEELQPELDALLQSQPYVCMPPGWTPPAPKDPPKPTPGSSEIAAAAQKAVAEAMRQTIALLRMPGADPAKVADALEKYFGRGPKAPGRAMTAEDEDTL